MKYKDKTTAIMKSLQGGGVDAVGEKGGLL